MDRRDPLLDLLSLIYSAPDSVHAGINYGSVSPNTERVEISMYPRQVFLPVWYIFLVARKEVFVFIHFESEDG